MNRLQVSRHTQFCLSSRRSTNRSSSRSSLYTVYSTVHIQCSPVRQGCSLFAYRSTKNFTSKLGAVKTNAPRPQIRHHKFFQDQTNVLESDFTIISAMHRSSLGGRALLISLIALDYSSCLLEGRKHRNMLLCRFLLCSVVCSLL